MKSTNTQSWKMRENTLLISAVWTKKNLWNKVNLTICVAILNSRLLFFSAHSSNSATGIMGNQAADNDRFQCWYQWHYLLLLSSTYYVLHSTYSVLTNSPTIACICRVFSSDSHYVLYSPYRYLGSRYFQSF